MPINKNKYDCSGCTSCYNVCPVSCITMEDDALGFKYPKVDLERCINCDLCVKKCPFNDEYKTNENFEEPIAIAGKSNNPNIVMNSQSGAAFVILSDVILKVGGIIYGVGYDKHFRAITKRASNITERDEFRGSKYVQSNLQNIFKEVESDLKNNNIVLFSGTPCQVAGLNSYIPESLKVNLYTIDIICHGVPSPKIWEENLKYLEQKEGSKIIKVNFRDKSIKGWHSHIESYKFENNPNLLVQGRTYTYLFYRHLDLRYSCGNCYYTNLRRVADITIGDCWGIEKTKYKALGEDNKGCSLFLINTPKGKKLFDEAAPNLIFNKINISDVLQPQLQKPAVLSPYRGKFERDYKRFGYKYILFKYGDTGIFYFFRKIRNKISYLLKSTNNQ